MKGKETTLGSPWMAKCLNQGLQLMAPESHVALLHFTSPLWLIYIVHLQCFLIKAFWSVCMTCDYIKCFLEIFYYFSLILVLVSLFFFFKWNHIFWKSRTYLIIHATFHIHCSVDLNKSIIPSCLHECNT